jgi:hypothetical protein
LNVLFELFRRRTLVSLPWNQVAKQHWLTAFVGGVFLLVLGTTKGIPAWGLAADAPFHYVLIVVGVALLLVAIVFMWLAFHRTATAEAIIIACAFRVFAPHAEDQALRG